MDDNGAKALEGKDLTAENGAPHAEEKVAAEPAAVSTPLPAEEPAVEPAVVPMSDEAVVRTVFVARATAWKVEPVGSFANIEASDEGLAVRGAYRAHLAAGKDEGVAAEPEAEGDLLRKAYLARAVADTAVQAPSKSRPAKRGAARVSKSKKKAAGRVKRSAASRSPSKPKKRGAAAAKPRVSGRRAVGQSARRGKRRGR